MRLLECLTSVGSATAISVAIVVSPVAMCQNGAFAATPAAATAPKATATQAAIAQLEEKLYEHKYAAESDDARLTRIEKFVFGAAQTGTAAERVQRLQDSISSQASAIDKPPAPADQAKSASSLASATSSTASAPSDAVTSSSTFDGANYPRVTELEQDMLNTTYVHEPLPQRLSRLESKAFGKPSKSNDLCARVDDLDEYAETHQIFKNHKDPLNSSTIGSASSSGSRAPGHSGIFSNSFFGGSNFPGASDSFDNDDDSPSPPKAPVNPFVNGVTGTDQRLSSIEEFVYGHNYATKPVQDRLERLEKRLVPYQHNLAQKDVTYRVNNIWNILSVANTFNSAPTAAHPANTAAAAAAAPPASTASHPASTAVAAASTGMHSAGTAVAAASTPTHPANTTAVANGSTISATPASRGISAPSQATLAQATVAHHSWLHQLAKSLGSANVSNAATSAPGAYPPDIAPKPGHVYVP